MTLVSVRCQRCAERTLRRLVLEYLALVSQWPIDFRVPGGRVRVRLWARDLALPEVRGLLKAPGEYDVKNTPAELAVLF